MDDKMINKNVEMKKYLLVLLLITIIQFCSKYINYDFIKINQNLNITLMNKNHPKLARIDLTLNLDKEIYESLMKVIRDKKWAQSEATYIDGNLIIKSKNYRFDFLKDLIILNYKKNNKLNQYTTPLNDRDKNEIDVLMKIIGKNYTK